MKNTDRVDKEDDLREEYDFEHMAGGVRGKYVERYRAGTNVVVLDPDVAAAFPNSEAVNKALRMLLEIATDTCGRPGRRRRRVA